MFCQCYMYNCRTHKLTRFRCNLRVNSAMDMLYELIDKYSVLFITIQTRTMFTCMQLRLPTHKQRRVSYVLIHTHKQIKSKQARSQNAHKNKRTGSPTCWIYHHAFTLYVLAKNPKGLLDLQKETMPPQGSDGGHVTFTVLNASFKFVCRL